MVDIEEYINQYKILYVQKPKYGMTSIKFYNDIIKIISEYNVKSILDYGCGKSELLDCIKRETKIDIYKYDPAILEYSKLPNGNVDFVICTDVLQHIPLYDLDRVLTEIKGFSMNCFFHIRCTPYHTLLPNGEFANCTVYPPKWWRKVLKKYFNSVYDIGTNDNDTVSFITRE